MTNRISPDPDSAAANTQPYIQGDLDLGWLENHWGDRLVALPELLVQSMYSALGREIGTAAGVVLFNCGRWWGQSLYTQVCQRLASSTQTAIADLSIVELLLFLQQDWVAHGWGRLDLDQTYQPQGFLVVKIWNSPFANQAPAGSFPVCYVEAGLLSSFFSQLTGQELHCVQTTCESLGADCNRFILGSVKRLQSAETMVMHLDHDAILQQLCR
jgi:uncharacterized protein